MREGVEGDRGFKYFRAHGRRDDARGVSIRGVNCRGRCVRSCGRFPSPRRSGGCTWARTCRTTHAGRRGVRADALLARPPPLGLGRAGTTGRPLYSATTARPPAPSPRNRTRRGSRTLPAASPAVLERAQHRVVALVRAGVRPGEEQLALAHDRAEHRGPRIVRCGTAPPPGRRPPARDRVKGPSYRSPRNQVGPWVASTTAPEPPRPNASAYRSSASCRIGKTSPGSWSRSRSSRTDTPPTSSRSPPSSAVSSSTRPSSPSKRPANPAAVRISVAAGGTQGSGGGSPARLARICANAPRARPRLPPPPFWRSHEPEPFVGRDGEVGRVPDHPAGVPEPGDAVDLLLPPAVAVRPALAVVDVLRHRALEHRLGDQAAAEAVGDVAAREQQPRVGAHVERVQDSRAVGRVRRWAPRRRHQRVPQLHGPVPEDRLVADRRGQVLRVGGSVRPEEVIPSGPKIRSASRSGTEVPVTSSRHAPTTFHPSFE